MFAEPALGGWGRAVSWSSNLLFLRRQWCSTLRWCSREQTKQHRDVCGAGGIV